MKFIFPQNYDFKNKFLGIIDYTTAFFNLLWDIFILFCIHIIFDSLRIKIFLFIVCSFPLLLFSLAGFNGENIITVISYLIRFAIKPKLFLYKKS